MALPTLTPASKISAVILPPTGSTALVDSSVPYRVYSDAASPLYSESFLSGAVEQVAYVHKKLGGDILDIELTPGNVYAAYEEAVLEYSYMINVHQAYNILSNTLGNSTGSFDHKGNMSGDTRISSSLANDQVPLAAGAALKYPKFDFGYSRRISEGAGSEIGLKDSMQFSASFSVVNGQQDYDLQKIVQDASTDNSVTELFEGQVDSSRILIKKVYYKTPQAMWRFFGYYGGLNVVGNMHSYGQFMDDSTFQLIPTWQNKAQAMAFEDAIYTRMSHWSYQIRNNNLRLYPIPQNFSPKLMWIEFSIPSDAWDETVLNGKGPANGVNNMNTLPLGNVPYDRINSIGKQWIRRFALSICKEILGQVRSKFGSVPIPGSEVQLNGSDLISQSQTEQEKLREELKTMLSELTYAKLVETDANMQDNAQKVLEAAPHYIFVG
tara:strand:- start:2539 stop:3852 length:1314 start_codon:yes stop_codon:yes gene_type:complete